MSRKTISWILILVGLLLAVVSMAADSIGIGSEVGFGWKQIVGAVIGVAAMLVGFWLTRRKIKEKK